MRRHRIIAAEDRGQKIRVDVTFTSCGLTLSETERVERAATRACADAIRNLPYVSFGPENTTIR